MASGEWRIASSELSDAKDRASGETHTPAWGARRNGLARVVNRCAVSTDEVCAAGLRSTAGTDELAETGGDRRRLVDFQQATGCEGTEGLRDRGTKARGDAALGRECVLAPCPREPFPVGRCAIVRTSEPTARAVGPRPAAHGRIPDRSPTHFRPLARSARISLRRPTHGEKAFHSHALSSASQSCSGPSLTNSQRGMPTLSRRTRGLILPAHRPTAPAERSFVGRGLTSVGKL
jgi:hypothetical protein